MSERLTSHEQAVRFADIGGFADGVRKVVIERVTRIVYERTLPFVPVGPGMYKGKPARHLVERMEYRTGSGGGYGVIKANAPHAHLVIKGTSPHVIMSKQGALAFDVGGDVAYAKVAHHPGAEPNDFLQAGLAASSDALAQAAAQGDILAKVKVK